MLVIAYTVGKVHHKRQRTLAEAATGTTDLSMKMQGNEAYISTFHTDECYTDITDMEANLAYRHVSTLSMKMQGNEAYCASTINMADKVYEIVTAKLRVNILVLILWFCYVL